MHKKCEMCELRLEKPELYIDADYNQRLLCSECSAGTYWGKMWFDDKEKPLPNLPETIGETTYRRSERK